MSMGAGDELEPVIGALARATQEGEQEGMAVGELPEDMSVDLRGKLAVCMINLNLQLPEVSP